MKEQLIRLCEAYELPFRCSETQGSLASKLVGCIQSKRSMPFTATVDDQQYQVIASHADDSTGSVRIRIRLSRKKAIYCTWHNGYIFIE